MKKVSNLRKKTEKLLKDAKTELAKSKKPAKSITVKYRIHVGDRMCEVDSGIDLQFAVSGLVNGRSKLQNEPVKPEDIRITIHRAKAEPGEVWRKV